MLDQIVTLPLLDSGTRSFNLAIQKDDGTSVRIDRTTGFNLPRTLTTQSVIKGEGGAAPYRRVFVRFDDTVAGEPGTQPFVVSGHLVLNVPVRPGADLVCRNQVQMINGLVASSDQYLQLLLRGES